MVIRLRLILSEFTAHFGGSSNIDELDPFVPSNLGEAIHDLGIENKHNRLVRESLFKTICHVSEVILGERIAKSMPTPADIEALSQALVTPKKGTKWIVNLKSFCNYLLSS